MMYGTLFLIFTVLNLCNSLEKLQEVFNWRSLDYEYPTDELRQYAKFSKDFIPENNLPVGIEVWRNKLFVSVPRWEGGVPSTLNYIPLDAATSPSPNLIPYPSWEANSVPSQPQDQCDTLTTVYRLKADACDRLWVLDAGTIGLGNTTKQICPYAIHVFDLKTDRRIRKYQFRPEDTVPSTFIANIAIDMGNSCEDTFLYASDELGYGLIAYSWELNTSWRTGHGFFFPDPLLGEFNVGGIEFHWFSEGIFGITLTPPESDGFRNLLFHPIASHSEFYVSTRVLRNKTLAESPESYVEYKKLGERGPKGHLTAHVMDDNGILYYNLIDRNAIGCWNSRNPYNPEFQGHVDQDDEALIFPSDVKVVGDDLWIMSDRMPIHLESTLNFNDINFRIFIVPIRKAISGTVCDGPIIDKVHHYYNKPAVHREQPLPVYDDVLYQLLNYNRQVAPKNYYTKKVYARPELPSYLDGQPIQDPVSGSNIESPQSRYIPVFRPASVAPQPKYNPAVSSYSYTNIY